MARRCRELRADRHDRLHDRHGHGDNQRRASNAHDQLAQSGEHRLRHGIGSTQLDATARVAGTFGYSPASGTVLKAGNGETLGVTFTPTDSSDYTTVTATATSTLRRATPTISWPNPANIVYGTALGSTQLDATASVSGTFTYSPASGTVLKAGNGQTLSRDIHADRHDRLHDGHGHGDDQRGASDAHDHLAQPGEYRLRHGTGSTQLDATASVSGTFTYSPASAPC